MDRGGFSNIDASTTGEATDRPRGSIFSSPRNFMDRFKSLIDPSHVVYQLFYFFYFAAFGSLFPLISIYFKQLGLNAIQVGLLSGTRSLIECVAAPFWTALADKWKKGKTFVLVSLICSMAFTLGIGFVRPSPEGCLVSLPRRASDNLTSDKDNFPLTIIQPYKASRYDDVKSVDMDRDLAMDVRNQIGQSPLFLDTNALVSPPQMKAARFVQGAGGRQVGDQNLYSRTGVYHDPTQYPPGSLVMPLYSTVVYSQTKINQIFIILILLVLFGEIMSCAAIPLVDATVIQQLGVDYSNTYERQRIFGSVGWALAMFFIGLTLDHSTSFPDYPCLQPGYREKNYMVCFATYSVFIAFALFTATQLTFSYEGDPESMYFKLVKDKMARTLLGRTTKNRSKLVNEEDPDDATDWKPSPLPGSETVADANPKTGQSNEEILEKQLGIKFDRRDGTKVGDPNQPVEPKQDEFAAVAQLKITKWLQALRQFGRPQLLLFLFVTWFMGLGIGQVFTFLFWHMQELNGSPTLFGIASVINHVSEILMYYFSKQLIDKIGHLKVLYLGLIGNVARFLYVSWITNPWWILPFEFIQGLTHAGVWVACCSYITQAFHPELRSSTLGFLRAVHYGLGRGLGACFGGLVISSYGTSAMFRAYGAASTFVLLVFLMINYFMPIPPAEEENKGEHKPFDDNTTAGYGLPGETPPNVFGAAMRTNEATHDYYLQQQPPQQQQQQPAQTPFNDYSRNF